MKKSKSIFEESGAAQNVGEPEKLPASSVTAAGNEEERLRRQARLIELGRSCRSGAEQCPEEVESNKSPQSSPNPGRKKLEVNFGFLLEIYGDKPFMVRPDDPYTNLLPDDPDRDYNRDDFDMERE